jgi:hypothetical protein
MILHRFTKTICRNFHRFLQISALQIMMNRDEKKEWWEKQYELQMNRAELW